MFCPKDHILFMKIGFPSGHIKNQAIPLWGSKNKIVETPSSYLSKRVQKGQKANGKRIESIGCFVFEKNPKNTQNNQFFGNRFFQVVFGIFLKNKTRDWFNSFSIGLLPFSGTFWWWDDGVSTILFFARNWNAMMMVMIKCKYTCNLFRDWSVAVHWLITH